LALTENPPLFQQAYNLREPCVEEYIELNSTVAIVAVAAAAAAVSKSATDHVEAEGWRTENSRPVSQVRQQRLEMVHH